MIVVIDYDTGNIRSVANALKRIGAEFCLTAAPEVIRSADHVILPGVGEAASAMENLRQRGLDKVIPTLTCPVLGICIGLQLMCRHSAEGDVDCLGIFPVEVARLGRKESPSGAASLSAPAVAAFAADPAHEFSAGSADNSVQASPRVAPAAASPAYPPATGSAASSATGPARQFAAAPAVSSAHRSATGSAVSFAAGPLRQFAADSAHDPAHDPAHGPAAPDPTRVATTPDSTQLVVAPEPLKIPHVGWNTVTDLRTPLFAGLAEDTYFYFVHSYAAQLCTETAAVTEYGTRFSAALARDNFFGTQFHPEKSGEAGEHLLRNFLQL